MTVKLKWEEKPSRRQERSVPARQEERLCKGPGVENHLKGSGNHRETLGPGRRGRRGREKTGSRSHRAWSACWRGETGTRARSPHGCCAGVEAQGQDRVEGSTEWALRTQGSFPNGRLLGPWFLLCIYLQTPLPGSPPDPPAHVCQGNSPGAVPTLVTQSHPHNYRIHSSAEGGIQGWGLSLNQRSRAS